MREYAEIKEKIEKERPLKLSTSFTKPGVYFGVVVAFIMLIFSLYKLMNNSEGLQISFLLAFLLSIGLLFFAFHLLFTGAEAELIGTKLKLKKIVGFKYEIGVNQIESMSTFNTKSTKYTWLKFKTDFGISEKVVIMGSNSILFGRDVSVEQVIKVAQELSAGTKS